MLNDILFFFFSFFLLFNSLCVIVLQNSVYSAFFLVLSFVSASAILFIFECEFVAILFVIIYVGAIAILFLFVVMMLNIKVDRLTLGLFGGFPFGAFVSVVFLFEIFYVLYTIIPFNPIVNDYSATYFIDWFLKLDPSTEIEVIGQLLYGNFAVQFLVAGSILLLAVIGSVVLSFNFNKFSIKQQSLLKQNSRSF